MGADAQSHVRGSGEGAVDVRALGAVTTVTCFFSSSTPPNLLLNAVAMPFPMTMSVLMQ